MLTVSLLRIKIVFATVFLEQVLREPHSCLSSDKELFKHILLGQTFNSVTLEGHTETLCDVFQSLYAAFLLQNGTSLGIWLTPQAHCLYCYVLLDEDDTKN